MAARDFDPERYARRLAPAGALLAVVGGCAGGGVGLLLASVGVLLLLIACVSRREGLLLLGPIARAELVRAARTKRPWLWRTIYALVAGAILIGNVYSYAEESVSLGGAGVPTSQLQYINAQVTNWFAICLFGYVCILTVQLMAPIVAEEREAGRLDALLITELRSREILLGKAVGRLPMILDPVLASLPILALTPLLGGVSPIIMAWFGVAILAAILGLSAVAILYSVVAANAAFAMRATVMMWVLYLLVFGSLTLFVTVPSVWTFPSSVGLTSPVEVGDMIEAVNAGNPMAALGLASHRAQIGVNGFEAEFGRAVRRFAAFQVGVFGLFGLTAMARLRRVVPWLVQPRVNAATVVKKWRARPIVDRPPVGDMPVYWWERYGALSQAQLRSIAARTPRRYAIIGLISLAIFAGIQLAFSEWKAEMLANGIIASGLWLCTWAVMVPPLFRAARTVAAERVAGTLDSLRLTALGPRDVLYEKWLASAASERGMYFNILVVALAAVLTGLLHPLSLIGFAITLPVYSASAAAIGLYFSVRAATPGRAVRNMLLIAIPFGYMLALILGSFGPWLPQGLALAIGFPPVATGLILFVGVDQYTSQVWNLGVVCVLIGMLLYAGLGWMAWRAAVRRFEQEWTGG